MSTKKDKFSSKDKNYMRLALNLARARKGLTGENPSVGCVIVKNDKVISVGQTGINGRPHAETNAINNSLENLKDSNMYVSLEPCNHFGTTPPCTNKIINSGIKSVIFSLNDIDKKVRGKTYNILKKKKIDVKKGLLKKDAIELYKSYFINRINKLPFVTGKIAMSKNNIIYNKGTKRITNQTSDKLSHYLRFKNDAIMISSKTLNVDNPRLNCRLKGYENFSPKRIILDKNLEINLDSNIFKSAKNFDTIIFYNSLNNSKFKIIKNKKIKLVKIKLNKKKQFDLKIILKKVYLMGVRNLLVEGGEKLTKSFLSKRLFDQFYLFKSPKILSKNKKHLTFTSINILNNEYKIRSKLSSKLAKDNITIYKR
jgi:diaminohydroxyphosphoribosylaminopyrimidine deaminase/5-amino-6-(5-phosphoribosylamino)uracil reductase